ncbi:MAG: hypothetical protein G01um10148_1058 [Parcubacteria group bacterium Gr01-1014_8]|nr:MAG: hypothetical protein G01um10148_1058 [Parcubacteria group bacterium Gr01-1014_8]
MIATELGIQSLPAEKQVEIIEEIGEALMDRVILAVWKKVPPQELAKMAEKAKREDDETGSDPRRALEFLQQYEQYIPNFAQFLDSEIRAGLQAYRAFMLGAGATQTSSKKAA